MQQYEALDEIEFDKPANEYAITSDAEAGWAMRRIKTIREKRDRYVALCRERYEAYTLVIKAEIDNCEKQAGYDEQYLTTALRTYYDGQPESVFDTSKKTGVRNLRLPEGKLVLKPAGKKLAHDDDALLKALRESGMAQYIRIKESPAWDEIKKAVVVGEDGTAQIPDIDGALTPVEGVWQEATPATFSVEVK